MALEFGEIGYESLFKQALSNGISLFCSAGFSVEALDKKGHTLPVGATLLDELKAEFPSIQSYKNLPKACTKLLQTDKGSFYSFLNERFTVETVPDMYKAILNVNVRNIYTTNIDNLFFKLYESSDNALYLADRSVRGDEYTNIGSSSPQNQVNYFPLHGCVRTPGDYVFGATDIASAFSQKNRKQSWSSLATDAEQHAILFWGWNFEDSGPIESMYGGQSHVNENEKKWVLLHNPDEETIDFLSSLNFSIIKGDTKGMLQYLQTLFQGDTCQKEDTSLEAPISEKLNEFLPPLSNEEGSYPLKSFFCDYTPRWSYIYSKSIPRLSYYKKIAEWIAGKKTLFLLAYEVLEKQHF